MRLSALLLLLPLCACASIIDGSSQQITINTSPESADCELVRQDLPIGRINPPPGRVVIKKTKHDIIVTCKKSGYETTKHFLKSGSQDATWGNIVAGGGIGWAIDSASGADNYYETPVNISLPKK